MAGPNKEEIDRVIKDIQNEKLNIMIDGDLQDFLGVNIGFAMFFGGTSLLILVAVVLDTLQQIDSHLLMRKYDGLVKSGKGGKGSRVQGIGASM